MTRNLQICDSDVPMREGCVVALMAERERTMSRPAWPPDRPGRSYSSTANRVDSAWPTRSTLCCMLIVEGLDRAEKKAR
jgi:hypothetical protein